LRFVLPSTGFATRAKRGLSIIEAVIYHRDKVKRIIMKKWILAASLCCNMAFADVAVVVHPSNGDSLDKATISRLFLNKAKAFPNGTRAEPVALAEGNAVTDEFNGKVLNKTASQLTAFWSKLVFTGKGQPPKSLGSDAKVLSTVAGNPGAIGYVDAGAVNDSVRVVATF
jgi:ABC-type phosphate transport system substrate-binding protein